MYIPNPTIYIELTMDCTNTSRFLPWHCQQCWHKRWLWIPRHWFQMHRPNSDTDGILSRTRWSNRIAELSEDVLRIPTTFHVGPKFAFENQLLIPTTDPGPPINLASTFSAPAEYFQWQERIAGSDKMWNDIILKNVLSITKNDRTKGRVKDALPDWSLATLNSGSFFIFDFHPATITIMHELTHSAMAMGPGNEISMLIPSRTIG